MPGISVQCHTRVNLIQHTGSDLSFCMAARQSTGAEDEREERNRGLIRSLISKRHTSPFEHSSITFEIETPFFVARQWHRHRTQSYSERSGRYTEVSPKFWLPIGNDIKNVGTRMKPKRGGVDQEFWHESVNKMIESYNKSWQIYHELVESGVAEEVARTVIPLGAYTQFWATANLVNWLRFLSLRTHEESATVVSYPQKEIEEAARQIEGWIEELFPWTYEAWNTSGRTL